MSTDNQNRPAPRISGARAFAFNGGLLTHARHRRILTLLGQRPKLGLPRNHDTVLVWGHAKTSKRGKWVARKTGALLTYVEDAFLRSVLTGRANAPTLGLMIDTKACHFDSSRPSDLEGILAHHPLDDPALLARAQAGIDYLARAKLTKYTATPIKAPRPDAGYILVVDQTRGDASIHMGGAGSTTFEAMLQAALAENPNHRILIKTHPETAAGFRKGHFGTQHLSDRVSIWDAPIAPQDILAGADRVYAVSSQLGFEAILAGHRPIIFGQPFYACWSLTEDRTPVARRVRELTAQQIFAAAMILYPTWYDPCLDELCDFETAIAHLDAQTQAWREDHAGWSALGIRLWKRPSIQAFFGSHRAVRFTPSDTTAPKHTLAWGQTPAPAGAARVEDGFIRSKGLGAALTPPMSLVLDRSGIYYDPTRPSDLETMIQTRSETLDDGALARACRLQTRITASGVSKYNLRSTPLPHLPEGHRILVPGQVEDDASITLGTMSVKTNRDLLLAVRKAHPDAVLIYKPHPDVEAGLRKGAVPDAREIANVVAEHADPLELLRHVQEVWTMTSLLGFEALLREVPVTCLGQPFYAGWGLTTDRHPLERRTARPSLAALIHCVLVDYPRYVDPVTQQPCPIETVLHRLENPEQIPRQHGLRLLSKLQGRFASWQHLWR